MKKVFLLSLIIPLVLRTFAQADSTGKLSDLTDLSLEELMDIPIYSVSKVLESSFEAPLSSTVITRTEILNAGCTSIMEALRLSPEIIVREMANGTYDIHIRGLDNVPPNMGMYFFANSTTLVMIDNRPVYNYLHGGTFWETLPIDLNDVERIEIIRGPAAAMYGPNAMSGVINIITREPDKKGVYIVANGQYGRYNTGIANAAVGYKFNDRISAHVSGNFQTRERTENGYYVVARNQHVPIDTFILDDSVRNARYPHPKLAMRKYGFNGFIDYRINERASISLQGGGQFSEAQTMFASSFFTTARSQSYYGNLIADLYGVNFQASFLSGTQSPNLGVTPWKWDFNTTDLVLDYRFTRVRNLVITPGITYRRASYDDRKYLDEVNGLGFFNKQLVVNNLAAYLRLDYTAFARKLRLIAAGRIDKFFDGPKKPYFSWQLAATYKPHPNHVIRIVQSRANRAPLLINTYADWGVNFANAELGPGRLQIEGDRNLKLLTTDMLELGYRGRIKDNLEIDFVVFGSFTKNYTNIVYQNYEYDSTAARADVLYQFQNIAVKARQIGFTLAVNCAIGKFQIRPYVTVQQTTIYDYSRYNISPTADSTYFAPSPATQNIYSGKGSVMNHLATPTVYGGAYLNCRITKQLNLNVNPYFMSAYTQLEGANLTYNDGMRGVEKVRAKLLLNVVVSYTFFKKLMVFMNFKNCFNDNTREFYRADAAGFKVSGGAHFEF